MRSRLLASVATVVLATTGLLVLPTRPASAHCGAHDRHADLYHAGGVSFREGTRIRAYPHTYCAIRGLGYPSHGIDLHCHVQTDLVEGDIQASTWMFVRNTTTGVNGWARQDTLRITSTVYIPHCNQSP